MSEQNLSHEAEWKTRKQRIDPRLRNAGWKIVPFTPHQRFGFGQPEAVTEYPTEHGPADYALFVDGVIFGIVEAKKLTLGPQNVLTQAERYSLGATENPLNYRGYHVPFLYSTNGEVRWFHDIRHPLNRSRLVADFHTPNALKEMLERDYEAEGERLQSQPQPSKFLRPYQKEANTAIEQALSDRKRQMLVAMATGTGKTFTMVNEVYRLMKSGAGRRILFLVDRKALAAQAVRAFASFETQPGLKFDKEYEVYSQRFSKEDFDDTPFDPKVLPASYLTNPNPGHAFVYVCTIQRMTINLLGRDAIFNAGDEAIDDDAEKLDIPIHAFDIIIADECHRGYSQQEVSIWRKALDHFDAVKIGLTATPAAHTKAYFKDVVYRYEYERAVREGFLVDYDVVAVKSDIRLNGLFLREGEHVGQVDPISGERMFDYLEDEQQFETTDIERKVTSPDSNRRILEELRRYADAHMEEWGRFPKTLIFAANDLAHTSHSDQLVDMARDVFGRGDSFVQKITGKVDRPLQKIRAFRNREEPGIVVSVDLLTTGVDIPDLEYIVFLRPVKSRILFEQMLGRGTRKGDKYPDKSHFTVFDCFDGTLLKFFKEATGITAEPPDTESKPITEIIEEIWQNKEREYNTKRLVKRLQRIEKEMSGEGREEFAQFIPDGDLATFAAELPQKLKAGFTETMKLLRDSAFQNLLKNYKRPPRTFVVALESEDTVTSEWRVRGLDGKEYKPEDYLKAFTRFVTEHENEVEAIQILLNRPQGWGYEALKELRETLKASPERFTEDNLRRAYQITHHKALADIISMVKRAVDEGASLFTAEERVQQAIARVSEGRSFTDPQRLWLDRIKAHLIENLSIEVDDFDIMPALSNRGGWLNANRAFEGQLSQLLQKINEAVAV